MRSGIGHTSTVMFISSRTQAAVYCYKTNQTVRATPHNTNIMWCNLHITSICFVCKYQIMKRTDVQNGGEKKSVKVYNCLNHVRYADITRFQGYSNYGKVFTYTEAERYNRLLIQEVSGSNLLLETDCLNLLWNT